jgi:uncharacterized protein (TIGR03382 family)
VTITANDGYWTNPLTFVINQLPPPPNAPPVITVHESSTGSPLALTHGGVLNVPFGSRLMDLSITLQVTDADGDNVSLSATLLGDAGLLSDEWRSAARPAPFTLMPVAGLFDDPLGATHPITLVAHDGTDQSVFVLEIRQQARPSVTGTRTGSGAGCAAHAGTTAWAVLLAAGVILLGRRRRRAA